jgi:hypothetical protein
MNKRISLIISFLILFCLSSCTTVQFKSSGQLDLYVGGKSNHVRKLEIEGLSEFYLFGIIPKKNHIVYIDQELLKVGIKSAANITILEYQTVGDMWMSFFSMGFYIPTRFKISAYAPLDDDDKNIYR